VTNDVRGGGGSDGKKSSKTVFGHRKDRSEQCFGEKKDWVGRSASVKKETRKKKNEEKGTSKKPAAAGVFALSRAYKLAIPAGNQKLD